MERSLYKRLNQTKFVKTSQEIVEMRVDGMDCNNCAMSIQRFLERKGLEEVLVNFQTREVRYRRDDELLDVEGVRSGIRRLGFTVVETHDETGHEHHDHAHEHEDKARRRLLFCAILTAPLLIGHLLMTFGVHLPLMHNRWLQLALAGPVYLVGGLYFGRSALAGLRERMLNMDVLIFLGATAAFAYSMVGFVWQNPDYYFFETAATIITLVLVGNWLEARAVERTTTAISALTDLQEESAHVMTKSGTMVSLPVEEVRIGQHLRVNTGDKIPLDGELIDGNITVNEAMLTGESLPVERGVGEAVLGGSIIASGQATYRVTAGYKDGTLARIIELVKTAQADKPSLQRLADRVSAIFVPVVIGIAILTFLLGWGTGYATATQALMNAIAVLLISCPCAMGLATPTAVMVGVGRLARLGVLIRGGSTVERFADIERMVFDKTGTLTTGDLQVDQFMVSEGEDPGAVRRLIYDMEQFSSHPIAGSVRAYLLKEDMNEAGGQLTVTETPGLGLRATNEAGDQYYLGAARKLPPGVEVPKEAAVVLLKNDHLLAWLSLADEVRVGARTLVQSLAKESIETILLTGDQQRKADAVAKELGIDTVFAEQLPDEKLQKIAALSAEKPTAMVGDGINDAAALSRADLGISLGGASAAALDAAQVVLLRDDLSLLTEGRKVAALTLRTIKESLFWAFSYNIVAIPLAALGFLNPMWAALFMAFSDVVVIGNAIRLKGRKA
ncbi:heavy metal translocating P-type ATPase [Neolewinella agarilytica]|uniref:Cu+-exporting ATPase n=1 Tax=Neolewinella agarilytica TaxID=478744 RepID=A0A1H9HWJ6_9BACT|nr:cation-translocating P-type ATPase [Neolewinella agarilytica]SEQ66647.1 Cu+-exporting ATPase [Neolewinella agarilytica]